ncbi:MAG: universal stress protein [Halobacteriales archaeon]
MTDRPTVLVPIRVLEGESIPEGVPELLANAHVVLLGYHAIPDQTAPGQARSQFGDRATDRLEDLTAMLEDAGATVDSRLVFTHEAQKTINRTILEWDCLAVLVQGGTGTVDDVLVAIRGSIGLDRLVRLVAGLFAGTDVGVTLYHVAPEEETDEDAEMLLDGVVSRLAEAGLAEAAIDVRIARDVAPVEAIRDAAESFDVVVMGESDPSIATFVFGMSAEQVADRFLGPVLVVQREPPESESPEDASGDDPGSENDAE